MVKSDHAKSCSLLDNIIKCFITRFSVQDNVFDTRLVLSASKAATRHRQLLAKGVDK